MTWPPCGFPILITEIAHGDGGRLADLCRLVRRDTLTAGWQACVLSTSMAEGASHELPKWQGKVENDWRDEQPGCMLHEAHTVPLAELNYNPRSHW